MDVYFVDEFVKVVFVTSAEVNESLNSLIGVGGDILALCALDHSKHVISKGSKVGHAVIDIGGFINTDERFVEDCKEIAEKLEGDGLFRSQCRFTHIRGGNLYTSSITLSIIALSRCLVYSFNNCLR